MRDFRTLFFQTLLLILALAFTFAIRYVAGLESARTGSFGEKGGNVTVSQAIFAVASEVEE